MTKEKPKEKQPVTANKPLDLLRQGYKDEAYHEEINRNDKIKAERAALLVKRILSGDANGLEYLIGGYEQSEKKHEDKKKQEAFETKDGKKYEGFDVNGGESSE